MSLIKSLLELNKNTYLFLAVGWLCLITLASLAPLEGIQDVGYGIKVSDKLIHGIFYFVNTVLCFLYVKKIPMKNTIVKVLLFSFVYGIVIEILQYLLPYERSFDFKDIVANLAGILAALFLIRGVLIRQSL